MNEETKGNDTPAAAEIPAAASATDAAMAKAIEGGYVAPEPVSREERVASLIAEVEHAMAHNAPMTTAMLAEMRALLGE